ncbi:uncharacterized protein LOC117328863 isoform X2 [Pecten maximus]|uniref:uncharacterized protein LOC117328863 isoform X2 n=1 Tax=Pecten maximus TaxID=6579 RepID=UPI001458933C|nr:uncharacterized protein LOC117328863 isoform X2 [Pecten maximus]
MKERMVWCFQYVVLLSLGISSVKAGINDSNGETTGLTGEQLFAVMLGGVLGVVVIFGCVYYLYTRDHSIYDCGSYDIIKRCCTKCKHKPETSNLPK